MVIKLYKITINLFSSPRPFPVVLNCTTSQSIFRAPPGHALRYLLPEREMSFRRNISPSATYDMTFIFTVVGSPGDGSLSAMIYNIHDIDNCNNKIKYSALNFPSLSKMKFLS
jgi:hypothetical protein